jgi:hypothetical protein
VVGLKEKTNMDVDLDTFYAEFLKLKERAEPVLAQFERGAALAEAALAPVPSDPAAARAMAVTSVGGHLFDWAGKLIGLDRVTIAGGHGFDEDDASYERRLRAQLGMMQRPEASVPQPEPDGVDVDPAIATEAPSNVTGELVGEPQSDPASEPSGDQNPPSGVNTDAPPIGPGDESN